MSIAYIEFNRCNTTGAGVARANLLRKFPLKSKDEYVYSHCVTSTFLCGGLGLYWWYPTRAMRLLKPGLRDDISSMSYEFHTAVRG